MRRVFYIKVITTLILFASVISAQYKKDIEDRDPLNKILRIQDRAGGTHNASNIGLFFENRGKLYPRNITWGPSGEFPINSAKNYIYRINQYVGIPGNVIQGRFTTNEEWEAVFGFHNSDTARVAMSDDPNSWHPERGWPVKNPNGKNIILSDQDSYCVFNDSNNTVQILGIQVAQTGYAFGTNFAKNILFFKYELTNTSQNTYDSLYFHLHNDIDVGDISGGLPEWGDDKMNFVKSRNLIYFYDDGISGEWSDGKTGFFGVMMLKTPEINGIQPGVTDMHYMLYDDDEEFDKDSLQYWFMSSDSLLYNLPGRNKYFHLGSNTNLHFDDPATIPASGMDIQGHISSGPYTIGPSDTLIFYTAFIAGETYDEMINAATVAQNAVDNNFDLPKPPTRPNLFSSEGDFRTILYWDDSSEQSFDKSSGYDFEGYRLYRSKDKGITWNKIADYDVVNSIGSNTGLKYSYTDTTVINGFEYWYSLTAYDRGSSTVESLEGAIGNSIDAENTVSVTPRSDAIGRTALLTTGITNLNTGNTNYILNASVIDNESLSNNDYKTTFSFASKKEIGDLATQVTIIVTDSSVTKPYKYGVDFSSPTHYYLRNLSLNTIVGREEGYGYPVGGREVIFQNEGFKVALSDTVGTLSELRPEEGDLITINYSLSVVRNASDSIINQRPFSLNQIQTTTDGVSLQLVAPEVIQSVSRIGGTDNVDMTFEVVNEAIVKDSIYIASIEGNGTQNVNGFVLLSVSGTAIQLDTLFNEDTFTFGGIEGTITFPSNNPPSAGNKFSVETVKPVMPGINDSYSFKIAGSKVDYQQVKSELSKIKVVPNPYIVSSLWEPEFGELRKEPLRQIQFINLPPECTIYIFTVDADLIKTIDHNATNGTEIWDLRTEGGRELAAGMYIYVVKTKDSEYKERFAIIK